MKQIDGQLSLFDLVASSSDPINFFDSHFSVGDKFLFGVTRTPVIIYDMQFGDKFFKMWFVDLGFWHHCNKKSFNVLFFRS